MHNLLRPRTRKVKCDEGRPACYRCVSTGRTCDGYGIWGGGGTTNSHHKPFTPPDTPLDQKQTAQCTIVAGPLTPSPDAKDYFDWFKCRTALKLPGTFRASGFWTTLLFQASFSEPAVLHAVLALSSV